MAHVRAVGEVVGAIGTHEQLVEERGLVAGTARGIEGGLIRIGQRPQVVPDQRKGLVPRDRTVLVGLWVVDHGVRQPSVLFQLEIRLRHQRCDRVLREEFRRDAHAGGLSRHGLDAVLAELKGGSVLPVRPRTSGTVEAIRLILLEQHLVLATGNLLLDQVDGNVLQRTPAGRGVGVGGDMAFFRRRGAHGVVSCSDWSGVRPGPWGRSGSSRCHQIRSRGCARVRTNGSAAWEYSFSLAASSCLFALGCMPTVLVRDRVFCIRFAPQAGPGVRPRHRRRPASAVSTRVCQPAQLARRRTLITHKILFRHLSIIYSPITRKILK